MKGKFKVPRKAAGLTKVQKEQVKALVETPAETKYVAEPAVFLSNSAVPIVGAAVPNSIISGGGLMTAWSMIPRLNVGPGAYERLGNKVHDVTLKTDFQFWLNPAISGYPTQDITVRVYIVKPKPIKSNTNWASLPVANFYDAGDGTRVDLPGTLPVADKALLMYPVNREQFTVLKTYVFRLAKNQDSPSNGAGAACAPNLPAHQTKNFSHTYRHKSSLIYPPAAGGLSQIPENLSLMAFACITDTNAFGTTGPTSGTVLANARTHMYYKD